MGNCSSEHQHQSRLFRAENFTNDPSAFRVFVKKRNKFIPGWLKINDDEIVFSRGGNNFQFWPLAHLRRYGYTCSGVFFFESGRRCATGEGLHTFQSHQAERIFHMVQSKIKIEEYARCGSRAGSVASNGTHRVHSLVPNPGAAARIHPIQRFSSEGANNEFPPSADAAPAPSAPPPYSAYAAAAAASDPRRVHQNASPNSHCPSIVSAASSSMIPQHFVRSAAGGAMAVPPALSRDRPRSVVSNIEHGVVLHHRLPHLLQTTAGQLPPLQSHVATAPPPPPLLHQHRPPPTSNIAASSSASSLMAAAIIHAQQQQQQNGGYALSPAALAASASGSCMMNQSFHSVLDSTGGSGGSPWASQQQLEGEIVFEHVLGIDNRRRLAQQQQKSGHSPNPTAEPIRVAVPPPRPFQQQKQQQQQQRQEHVQAVFSGTELQQAEDPSVLLPTAAPPAARFRRCGESTAAYVNVDFDVGGARHVAHEGDGILPECMNQQQLNVRELHRTDHSRMEFLSTGPGAFMLSSSYGPMSMSTSMVASPSSHATALPPALIHHHHQQQQQQHLQHVQQQYPQQCLHHSFYAPRPSASFQQQMSASVSGALTTSNQPPPPPTSLLQANNESGAGGDEDGIRRNDAQFNPCGGPTINLLSPIKLMSPPHAGVMQQHQSNPPLSNTTTASSTPS